VVIEMRIDAFNKVSQLYKTNSVKSTTKSQGSSFSDKLEISQTGKDYQVAKQLVARTPDIRETKVNDIKQRMEAGTYHVSIEDVANKLVDEYLGD
jgi:negative regulator of flagellin synthesis FlgM